MFKGLLLILGIIVTMLNSQELVVTTLDSSWSMIVLQGPAQAKNIINKPYKVEIPTALHLELAKTGDIPDPFYRDNSDKLKWVSNCTVKFTTTFQMSYDLLKMNHHQIIFEGIDTYANVTLNNKNILQTNNSFRKYIAQIKDIIKVGQNTVEVIISPTLSYDDKGQSQNRMPFDYAHTRKPSYQYSWDWAPYLNTLSIHKIVYIQSFNVVKIDYVWARNRFISSKKATINIAVALQLPNKMDLGNNYYIRVVHKAKQLANIKVNDIYTYIDIDILQPRLWWPNGIGQPYIYDFQVHLDLKQKEVDRRLLTYGIKTVQLDRSNEIFTLKVNGYKIYAKGANFVPLDMFYARLNNKKFKPNYTIEKLLDDVIQSNFNMIRIWGGGQYESDHFLDLASRKGIMIFYDFMFSDSIYPSTEPFLINVEQQAKQQIRLARNYPCLVLWSGNNQILQGVTDWGWNSQKYKEDYKKLFEQLLPAILQIQNPYIPYIPSSPVNSVGNSNFQRGGDFHYWGVWAGDQLFQSYKTAVGPFNSQFGTQALPVWQTVCEFTSTEDRSYESPVLLSHEKHQSKFQTLRFYIKNYMRQSLNFELETFQSGLVQAFAIEIAIIAQRTQKTKSWGTLYWQLNDAWPAISWSSIDYYGRWKPLQFMAKRLFPDVAIFYKDSKIVVVNDKLYSMDSKVSIKVVNFDGNIILSKSFNININQNQVKEVMSIDPSIYANKEKQTVIHMQITSGRNCTMQSTYFPVNFKSMELPEAQLIVEYHIQFNEMTLSSQKLIKNLYISNTLEYIKTSDNYFDLIPGIPRKIFLKSQKSLSQLKSTMHFKSYRQVYTQQQLKVIIKQQKTKININ